MKTDKTSNHTNYDIIYYSLKSQWINTQHFGYGVPQVLATFLALGELTNFLRLGFLRY